MAKQVSLKRIQISKANTTMMVSIAVSAFLVVFSLVAAQALWNKRGFQGRLIKEKETAVRQLEQNLATIDDLVVAYTAFVETPENVIGGNPNGTGDRDGDNAKITLDALPSKYDFPALTTSLEKLLKSKYEISGISGTDDEVNQTAAETIEPIEMPFEVSATGTIGSVKDLLVVFERSIRPLVVQSVDLSGSNSSLQISVSAKSYYQPEKIFNVQKKVIR